MIETSIEDGVFTIWLARPEARNALDVSMVRLLRSELGSAGARDDVRAIVLRSAVPGVFCTGMDLDAREQAREADPSGRWATDAANAYVELLRELSLSPRFTIAAIQGLAVGGGVDMTAACDFALADEDAAFSVGMLGRGIFPLTTSALVAPRIGYRRFLRWAIEARFYPAARCKELGLLTQVVPPGDLGPTTDRLAARICRYRPEAIDLGVRALRSDERETCSTRLKELEPLLAENLRLPSMLPGSHE